jgi:hypothetical protein
VSEKLVVTLIKSRRRLDVIMIHTNKAQIEASRGQAGRQA